MPSVALYGRVLAVLTELSDGIAQRLASRCGSVGEPAHWFLWLLYREKQERTVVVLYEL